MRRYLRFRVRTVLLLMCVVSVGLAGWTNRARRRAAALAVIERSAWISFAEPAPAQDETPWGRAQFKVTKLTFHSPQDITPVFEFSELKTLQVRPKIVVAIFSDDFFDLPFPHGGLEIPPEPTSPLDVGPLARFTNLEELQLNDMPLGDLSPLRTLKNLQTFAVARTGITDIRVVAALPRLTVLCLRETPVRDLTPLGNLRDLESLNVRGTLVTDLTPLDDLRKLKFLDIGGTPVRDLSSLDQLSQLGFLDVSNTPLTTEQIDKFSRSHPNCHIAR